MYIKIMIPPSFLSITQLLRLISTSGMRELITKQTLTNVIPPMITRLFPLVAVSTIQGTDKQKSTSNMLLPMEFANAISPNPENNNMSNLFYVVKIKDHMTNK